MKKKWVEKLKKNQNAITLIALTITIIVLLILAGVTIVAISGDNGILKNAARAKEETEQAEKDEKEKLGDMEDTINEYVTGIEVEQVTDSNPGELETDETDANTYIINSIEDLVIFASDVRNGNTYEGKTVKLGLSLDFNSNKSYVDPLRTDYGEYGYDGELKTLLTSGEGFIPIDTWYGVFDGNGKIIRNLYINQDIENQAARIGLFRLNYGTIQNLGLENTNISVKYNSDSNQNVMIGSLCGYNVDGIIDGCYNNGIINFEEKESNGHYIGGISGNNNSQIRNCYNKGKISISSEGTSISNRYVGGITAQNTSNSDFESSINLSDIFAEYSAICGVGGILGKSDSQIRNCYNIGNINVINTNDKYSFCIGGIIGRENKANIDNCCNIGTIKYEKQAENCEAIVGLISGENIEGIISNSKFIIDSNISGVGKNSGTDNSLGVDKLEDMPTILSIVGEKFKEDVNNVNNGYPILAWQ